MEYEALYNCTKHSRLLAAVIYEVRPSTNDSSGIKNQQKSHPIPALIPIDRLSARGISP